MKALFLFTILLLSVSLDADGQTIPQQVRESRLIRPGLSVGLLRLGDSRDRALKLFPQKPKLDSIDTSNFGTTYDWVDQEIGKTSKGNVFVHLQDDRVFQIDSATTRFRTPEGITIYASPEQVRRQSKNLRAYILSDTFSMATGERPLVYWIDSDKGIAFAFAYYPERREWYVYDIVVFTPHLEVRPLDDPSEKRELPPYSFPAK